MNIPILTTKLNIPPLRPILVHRPRLIERLNTGLHCKITVVSAPAGFGKTTLITEWLHGLEQPTAWYSLEESDNDPARFQAYFLSALKQIDPEAGENTLALLGSPQPPPPDVLMATLLNEIAAIPSAFILAIDDYHVIESLTIHQQLAYILEHQPPQMHLVLLSREDPPLPLPRLRVRSQITEIRQNDLRFTPQESTEFLSSVMGLKLSQDDFAALDRRTEGWIAGLQLAGLSMQGRDDLSHFVGDFTGSNRYVLDYLIEEVFERQPTEVRDFLLKTSILDRLCAPLCDAVMEQAGSQSQLESLEQANLFIIPLDQSRTWYRYHRLFTELLLSRLHVHGDLTERVLQQRASQWCRSEGLISEAIPYALAAEDWEQATEMLLNISSETLKRGEIVTLMDWYSRIPDDVVLSNPRLCYERSWPLILSSQYEPAGKYLAQAEKGAQEDPSFLGEVVAAQAYLARSQGKHDRMVTLSQLALSLLPESNAHNRCIVSTNLVLAYWHMGQMEAAEKAAIEALETARKTENHYAALTAMIFQGRVKAVRGQLRQAAKLFRQATQQGSQYPVTALAFLDLGILHYEWNNLEESIKHIQEAIQVCETNRNNEFLAPCWMMIARIQAAEGDIDSANKVLQKARQRIKDGDIPAIHIPRIAATQIHVALAANDLEAALSLEDQLLEDHDCHSFYRFINLTLGRLMLAQDKAEAANTYLAGCYEKASQRSWGYGMIATRVLQALAAPTQKIALENLTDALEQAQEETFIRTFVDAGVGLTPLLQEAGKRGTTPDYINTILAAIEGVSHLPVGAASLVEPLSARELEVLRLVAAGYSNPQIAEQLIISTGTVKTHVYNLCGKLGVRNRTEATARAIELGLV